MRYIYTESPEDKKELKKLKEKLFSVKAELHTIKIHKKSAPKGSKREKSEIIHEKGLQKEKKQLQDEIALLRSKYHKASIQNMDISIPFTDGFGISLKKG